MGKVTGFLEFERNDRDYQPVEERIRHWHEFVLPLPEKNLREQAARCMNCGVPYCHGTNTITGAPTGCPVNNQIPDWNDLVYSGQWQEAARNLHSTNNFPEVTGRVCPAPCEASCTLNIDDNPVTIKSIECEIADRAIAAGLEPERYGSPTGKKVAVVGSGPAAPILAKDKHVVVIGGGDTGSDCIGTSIRQGAASVTNFEIMPQPPEHENKPLTWPLWPLKLRTSSSHEEGVTRDFAVLTTRFSGEGGAVKKLHCARADANFQPLPGTEFEIDADLVLLAMGFVHPVHDGMIKALGLALDPRGNVKADTLAYQATLPKVFAAGDMRRGQSLVVWAIREGRQCAHAIDKFLMGSTALPR
jgi:NADPH-dependent glutamate synthase beta subunit-like oxidoreductase